MTESHLYMYNLIMGLESEESDSEDLVEIELLDLKFSYRDINPQVPLSLLLSSWQSSNLSSVEPDFDAMLHTPLFDCLFLWFFVRLDNWQIVFSLNLFPGSRTLTFCVHVLQNIALRFKFLWLFPDDYFNFWKRITFSGWGFGQCNVKANVKAVRTFHVSYIISCLWLSLLITFANHAPIWLFFNRLLLGLTGRSQNVGPVFSHSLHKNSRLYLCAPKCKFSMNKINFIWNDRKIL